MDQKKFKNISPRIKVIQKIYNKLINPDTVIEFPKNQYKKFIKDVVLGTLERIDLIEETINNHLSKDIELSKTDKLLKITSRSSPITPANGSRRSTSTESLKCISFISRL